MVLHLGVNVLWGEQRVVLVGDKDHLRKGSSNLEKLKYFGLRPASRSGYFILLGGKGHSGILVSVSLGRLYRLCTYKLYRLKDQLEMGRCLISKSINNFDLQYFKWSRSVQGCCESRVTVEFRVLINYKENLVYQDLGNPQGPRSILVYP